MEITIKINQRNKQAKALLEYIKTLPFVEIKGEEKEKSPYNPKFVKMVREAEKEIAEGKTMVVKDVEEFWESL